MAGQSKLASRCAMAVSVVSLLWVPSPMIFPLHFSVGKRTGGVLSGSCSEGWNSGNTQDYVCEIGPQMMAWDYRTEQKASISMGSACAEES